MARLSTNELKRLLVKHGCVNRGKKGKHEKWFSPKTGRTFAIPHGELKGDGTLRKILKDAGIDA